MYNISELVVTMASLYVAYNSWFFIEKITKEYPNTYKKIKEQITFLMELYNFMCNNNPLILDYYDSKNEKQETTSQQIEEHNKVEIKFEDKYLEKFKVFPNSFYFSQLELEEEEQEFEKLKITSEKLRLDTINETQDKLFEINEIQQKSNIATGVSGIFTENINTFGINKLLDFFDLHEEYDDDPDDIDFEELFLDLLKEKSKLENELKETENIIVSNDELREKARTITINKKLDKFIDNYVLEHTPLGNIYMRYNNSKGSFEYFSNNTIPYRYLEPVARKYVTTYWCKPIFVDIEEELKNAEIRYDDEKKKKEENDKRKQDEMKHNPKSVLAQMKNYNKDIKNNTITNPMKNRSTNNILPQQIKATLPLQNVSQTTEKQLLKDKANRYTWEGRFTGFCPLKKIDKKIMDKKLAMTYADFKKMQNK